MIKVSRTWKCSSSLCETGDPAGVSLLPAIYPGLHNVQPQSGPRAKYSAFRQLSEDLNPISVASSVQPCLYAAQIAKTHADLSSGESITYILINEVLLNPDQVLWVSSMVSRILLPAWSCAHPTLIMVGCAMDEKQHESMDTLSHDKTNKTRHLLQMPQRLREMLTFHDDFALWWPCHRPASSCR